MFAGKPISEGLRTWQISCCGMQDGIRTTLSSACFVLEQTPTLGRNKETMRAGVRCTLAPATHALWASCFFTRHGLRALTVLTTKSRVLVTQYRASLGEHA